MRAGARPGLSFRQCRHRSLLSRTGRGSPTPSPARLGARDVNGGRLDSRSTRRARQAAGCPRARLAVDGPRASSLARGPAQPSRRFMSTVVSGGRAGGPRMTSQFVEADQRDVLSGTRPARLAYGSRPRPGRSMVVCRRRGKIASRVGGPARSRPSVAWRPHSSVHSPYSGPRPWPARARRAAKRLLRALGPAAGEARKRARAGHVPDLGPPGAEQVPPRRPAPPSAVVGGPARRSAGSVDEGHRVG